MSEPTKRGRSRKAPTAQAVADNKSEEEFSASIPKVVKTDKEASGKVRLVAVTRPITNLVTGARYSLNVPSEPISLEDNFWEKSQYEAGVLKEF